jgi:hypothetical protein
MNKLLPLLVLLASFLEARPADAVLIKVTIDAITQDTTIVNSGDPCGTSGAGCALLPIRIEFVIDTVLAPADNNPSASAGGYAYFITQAHTTTFLTASATINGQHFASIPPPDAVNVQPFPFRQIVDLRDNLPNGLGGLLDRLFLQVDGSGNTANDPLQPVQFRFNLNTQFEMAGNELSGDGLAQLAGIGVPQPPALALVYGGLFRFTGATGDVNGGFFYTTDQVTFSLVPEPSLACLLAAGVGGFALARRRRG